MCKNIFPFVKRVMWYLAIVVTSVLGQGWIKPFFGLASSNNFQSTTPNSAVIKGLKNTRKIVKEIRKVVVGVTSNDLHTVCR